MLKLSKIAALIVISVSTTACVSSNKASQNAISETPPQVYSVAAASSDGETQLSFFPQPTQAVATVSAEQIQKVQSPFNVVDVQVAVPEYLVVSEADVYLPQADIVWREDPLGDRRAQVKAIVEAALRQGTAPLAGQRDVILAARVNMFHAITEKARNSVGGKHNVQFDYVLLDAETSQPITGVQNVDASFQAYGGAKAYRAMRKGLTQKVRITNHVAGVMTEALSSKNQI